MADNYVLPSDHLDQRQTSGNINLVKDAVGKVRWSCFNNDSHRTHGNPTPVDPVGAGKMIWPRGGADRGGASDDGCKRSRSSMATSQQRRQNRPSGKENRPHSPLTVVMQNQFARATEEEIVDRYAVYAHERERKQQPLKFKLTKHFREKIQKAREKPQTPNIKDRWLMKKFQNVPSHFEQERNLVKCSSAPDLEFLVGTPLELDVDSRPKLLWPQNEKLGGITKPVLHWPMQDYESDLTESRVSATPSSTHVSALRAGGSAAAASNVGEGSFVVKSVVASTDSFARRPRSAVSTNVPKVPHSTDHLGSTGGGAFGETTQLSSTLLVSDSFNRNFPSASALDWTTQRGSTPNLGEPVAASVSGGSTPAKVRPRSSVPSLGRRVEEPDTRHVRRPCSATPGSTSGGSKTSAGSRRLGGKKPCRSCICW